MRKILTIACVAMLSTGMVVMAQAPQHPNVKRGERKEMRQEKREHFNPEKRAEMMAKQLELTEAELVKLKALFEKQEAKATKHREEMKKQREEQRAKMEAERKANQADLIKIIGQEKFNELQAKRITHLQRENQKLKMRKDGDRPEFCRRMMMKQRTEKK